MWLLASPRAPEDDDKNMGQPVVVNRAPMCENVSMSNEAKPQTKNQHYVPKMLLRQFASPNTNSNAINVFNLARHIIMPQASIKGQCAGTFIYGEDDIIEQSLRELEGAAAKIIKNIIQSRQLPLNENDRIDLTIFIASQYGRTLAAGSEVNQQIQQVADSIIKSAKEHGIVPASMLNSPLPKISYKRPEIESLRTSVQLAPVIGDLEDFLIINDTSLEFAMNDTGVILYNHWTDGIRAMGTTGFACRGIMFFLPISPRLLLLKYDPTIYQIDGSTGRNYNITSDSEVKALNHLQIVFAEENVYFTGDKVTGESLLKLAKHTTHSLRGSRVRVKPFIQQGNEASKILHIHSENPKVSLCLPWLKIRNNFAKMPPQKRVPCLSG